MLLHTCKRKKLHPFEVTCVVKIRSVNGRIEPGSRQWLTIGKYEIERGNNRTATKLDLTVFKGLKLDYEISLR